MNKLFPWIGGDKGKQGSRSGKTPERASDALSEAAVAAGNGDIKAATKLFEESIRIYNALGMKQDEAGANHAFAVALAGASEYTLAFEAFAASIALCRTLNQKENLAAVLKNAGRTYAEYSDSDHALACLEECLSIFTSLHDTGGIADTLQALGRAAYLEGNWDDAQQYYNQCLAIYVDLGRSYRAALCLAFLSVIAVAQEDFETARIHYLASIDSYRSTATVSPLSETLVELGAAPFAERSAAQVTELLEAAIAVYSEERNSAATKSHEPIPDPTTNENNDDNPDVSPSTNAQRAEASACLILAPVAYSQGKRELALTLLDCSVGIAQDLSDHDLLCYGLYQAGGISTRNEDFQAAKLYYEVLNDEADPRAQSEYKAAALYGLASSAYHAMELDAATQYCEACLEIYKSGGKVSSTARTLALFGAIVHEKGDSETGLKLVNESLALCRHCGDTAGALGALQRIGLVARESDPVYARVCLLECLDSDEADEWRISTALLSLAELDLFQGEIGSAFEYGSRALTIRKELKDNAGVAAALELCAHIAGVWGDIETAVILISRSDALQTNLGTPRRQAVQERYESNLAMLKSEMGDEDFSKAWAEGNVLTLDEITDEVDLMLEDVEPEDEHADEIDELYAEMDDAEV